VGVAVEEDMIMGGEGGDDDDYYDNNGDGYYDHDGGGYDDDDDGYYDDDAMGRGGGERTSFAPISLEDAFGGSGGGGGSSYESLCRQHIESFMRGVELYAHETQLTKRIAEWQDRLEPLLDVQVRRRLLLLPPLPLPLFFS